MDYARFSKEVLSRLVLAPLVRALLLEFREPDLKAERIVRLLDGNPAAVDRLGQAWIEARKAKGEAPPEPARLLVALGMERSRDLLIAAELRGATARKLEHAREAEAQAARIPGEVPAIAYAAGLLFDQLVEYGHESCLAQCFERGLGAAQIASALGRRLEGVAHRRFLFGAALLHAAGSALLAAAEPDYARFEFRCEQKALPRSVFDWVVREKHGASLATLAALAARALGVFGEIEPLLLRSDEPYLLRGAPRGDYLFAAVLRLASNIAHRPMRLESETDPQLALWKGLELRELELEPAELVAISQMIRT